MTRSTGQLFAIFISLHQYCVAPALRPYGGCLVFEGWEKRERKLRGLEWSFGQRAKRFPDLNGVH